MGITIVIATPLGLLVAIYLTEYGRGPLAAGVRFVVDVMTGIPSIVAGLFIFAFLVIGLHQGYSGFAAGLSLTILMFPVVVRSAEEMIKLVPNSLREASYALGVPKWKTILRIVLPTASAGITTGVMLGIARVTGETAPLLLTSFVAADHELAAVFRQADRHPDLHLRPGRPGAGHYLRPCLGRSADADRHRAGPLRRAPDWSPGATRWPADRTKRSAVNETHRPDGLVGL